jgi:hypothetical protein
MFYDLERVSRWVEVSRTRSVEWTALTVSVGLSLWFWAVYGVVGVFVGDRSYWLVGALITLGVMVVALLIDLTRKAHARRQNLFGAILDWSLQQLNLVVVLIVAVGVPAATLFFGANIDDAFESDDASSPFIVARALQLLFIATVSFLPVGLFFLFDREQVGKLRDEFVRNVMRFDPSLWTKRDVIVRYRASMIEVFGTEDETSKPLLHARRSPLLLATLVLALGWSLVLLHPGLEPETRDTQELLLALFRPEQSPLAFAFLGAYFYALNSALRDYMRRDLWPRSYSAITVRVFLVMILAWVLEAVVPSDRTVLVLAFLTGVVPDTALFVIQREARRLAGRAVGQLPRLEERQPLTNLEGIDLYEQARLENEGITNIEALAHHDLAELMLRTRIPARRLVDWMDQAILHLHSGFDETTQNDALRALAQYGIRTATDLDAAVAAAAKADAESGGGQHEDELLSILKGDRTEPPRLRVILDVIDDDESMHNLRYWRGIDSMESDAKCLDAQPKEPPEAMASTTPDERAALAVSVRSSLDREARGGGTGLS